MNAVVEHMGWSAGTVRQRGGFYEADAELFPSVDVVVGYRLLFGVYSGIVPDGIDLVVTDIDWAGDATVLLSYVKGALQGRARLCRGGRCTRREPVQFLADRPSATPDAASSETM